jgi:hypothetical protein
MDFAQFFDALKKLALAFGLDGELKTFRLNHQSQIQYVQCPPMSMFVFPSRPLCTD